MYFILKGLMFNIYDFLLLFYYIVWCKKICYIYLLFFFDNVKVE